MSSTFEDLREERSEVTQALLELDCIPSGMELFPAADEDQWSLIKGVIDDCDYYVLIIGGRYGSIGPDGLSYTEMEYRYAVEKRKPVLAFIHSDPGSIPAGKTEQNTAGKEKLLAFRELASKKTVKFWASRHELGSVVSRSLVNLKKRHPAVGWVRADKLPSADSTVELLRLRTQVDELRFELERAANLPPTQISHLAHGEEKFAIGISFSTRQAYSTSAQIKKFIDSIQLSWNQIFSAISPTLMRRASTDEIRTRLNEELELVVRDMCGPQGVSPYTGYALRTGTTSVSSGSLETILVQFLALGYILRIDSGNESGAPLELWTLTPYGVNLMHQVRAIPTTTTD